MNAIYSSVTHHKAIIVYPNHPKMDELATLRIAKAAADGDAGQNLEYVVPVTLG